MTKVSPMHVVASDVSSDQRESQQVTEPRTFGSRNPFATSFHAMSPDSDVAMDSPLAHKKSAVLQLPVSQRISSNRISRALPTLDMPDSPTSPSPQSRSASRESTTWPILEDTLVQQGCTEDPTHCILHAADPAHDAQAAPKRKIADILRELPASISTWSLATGSSLYGDPEPECDISPRVKRLSWKSTASGSGPVLTIYGDAEAFLLGRMNEVPPVPSLPEVLHGKRTHDLSFGAFSRRFTRHPKPKLTSNDVPSPLTPNSIDVSTPLPSSPYQSVKISPIRSMRPPRKSGLDGITSVPSSPTLPTSVKVEISKDQLAMVSDTVINTDDHLVETDLPPSITSNSPELAIASNTEAVLGKHPETPKVATRKFKPGKWYSSGFIKRRSRAAGSVRSNTSPSLTSPSSSSSRSHQGLSHDRVRRPGPSKLRATESVTSANGVEAFERTEPSGTSSSRLPTSSSNGPSKTSFKQRLNFKRSIRDLFPKRDDKHAEMPAAEAGHQNASMTETRSSFAERIRASANVSRLYLSRMSDSKLVIECEATPAVSDVADVTPEVSIRTRHRRAALSSLEGRTPHPVLGTSSVLRYGSAPVMNNMLTSIGELQPDSPEQLRAVEVAEVCQTFPLSLHAPLQSC